MDKETYTLTLERSDQATGEPEQLPLLVFGEFNGHGRIETYNLPVQWIDPVRVVDQRFPNRLFAVDALRAEVHLLREGNDPQPVTDCACELTRGYHRSRVDRHRSGSNARGIRVADRR